MVANSVNVVKAKNHFLETQGIGLGCPYRGWALPDELYGRWGAVLGSRVYCENGFLLDSFMERISATYL